MLPNGRLFTNPITRGTRFAAEQWRAFVDLMISNIQSDTINVDRIGNNLVLEVDRQPMTVDHFLAKITGHSALTANVKYKYAWTEIRLSGNDDGAKTNARSGTTTTNFALNLVELNNTTAAAIGGDGVNAGGTSYATNFKRRPIGSAGTADTHSVDVPVMMFVVVDAAGDKRYVFSQTNAHDGACP